MNKLKQEFIGSKVEIIKSKNKTLIGLSGVIVDETKFTFKIKIINRIKTVLKNISVFRIGEDEIIGNEITKKPYERVKLKVKNER